MCTERYVNPFTDFGFKLLFGNQANREFLIEFLNSILDCPRRIVDISYNNTEVFGKSADDRKAVYDLYCETADGSHIIVEMQNAYQRYFMDRTIYYSSFLMQAAARRGEWDYRLPEVYTVAFLKFNMDDYIGDPSYKHVVRLMDIDTKQVFFNKLTYIYIEMPKFDKTLSELSDNADYWLYLIKNLPALDDKPESFRDKVFERFFRAAEIAKFTPEQRVAYETSLKIMRDYNNTVSSAEYKGELKGRAEGLAEGRAEGRAEGIAEGERTKALEIAKKLKQLGLGDDEIRRTTGITLE
ncbi:MAG: Rpn family recombination-promoting nuclease/putative transposase [Muribaculum sp.]|nr:Rpn family recombination-promoting nuclease/putative transposase [Muribaculum sp.]